MGIGARRLHPSHNSRGYGNPRRMGGAKRYPSFVCRRAPIQFTITAKSKSDGYRRKAPPPILQIGGPMSWWSYEKDASGRVIYVSSDYSGIYPFLVFLFLMGAMQYLVNPTGAVRFLLWSGFGCILLAKLSLFRRGIWNSWGTGQMTARWARLYKLGYTLIGLAVVLIIMAYRIAR